MNPIEIRLPELTADTEAGQLRQLHSYLYELAAQLQFALDAEVQPQAVQPVQKQSTQSQQAQQYAQLKALIIRSGEVAEAVAQKVETSLSGRYVAQSQFGTFTQLTQQRLEAGAEELRQEFSNWQHIESQVEQLRSTLLDVSASIRTGLLYQREDTPVYGVEIGQQERQDGVVRFRKFARLTADRLSFYDSNDAEVAFISDNRMHITTVEANEIHTDKLESNTLQMGAYIWQVGEDGHLSLR